MSVRIDTLVRVAASLLTCVILAGSTARPVSAEAGPLTLEKAIALALARSPALAARAMEAKAAEARVGQAGVRPNPEIAVELEDFGGGGAFRELESAQLTVRLAQTLELGGKRGKRKQAESLSSGLASLSYDWQRRMLVNKVTLRFVAVLAAQERLVLAREVVELQREIEAAVVKRVAAGKDPPLEETRVHVELAEAEIDRQSAERELALARKALVTTWGAEEAEFEYAVALDSSIRPPEDRGALLAGLSEIPILSRWELEEERARAKLSLAKAQRIPDLTLYGGLRHLWAAEEQALIAGFTVPVPLFDRNRGGVQEASHQVSSATAERQAAEARLRLELDEAYAGLTGAHTTLMALNEDIVPAAERTFETALAGYRSGKYEYLLVLDTQRTLIGVRARQVEAREDYFRARADVQLLVGPTPAAPGSVE